MKHTIEVKMPRLFGKKKEDDGTEVITEVDLEKKEDDISRALVIAGTLTAGLTIGYLVGYNRGVVRNKTHNVFVIK